MASNPEEKAELLSAADNACSKLAREAYVFGAGVSRGIARGVADKATDPSTLVEAVTAYSIGYGLGYLERRVPGLKLLGLAMTYSMVKDIALRAEPLGQVWSDTWDSSHNCSRNIDIVDKTLGRAVVDTAFNAAIGGIGARYGASSARLTDLYRALEKNKLNNNSLGTIRICTADGGVSYGTVFALDETHLTTSSHVVGRLPNYSMSVYSPGKMSDKTVTLLARDAASDLALLQSKVPHGIEPLKLAQTLPATDTRVVALGALRDGTGYRTFLPREGLFKGVKPELEMLAERATQLTLKDKAVGQVQQILRVLTGTKGVKGTPTENWAWGTPRLQNGMSGGPLVNAETLEVIGVNSFSIRNWISGFSSLSDLQKLVSSAGVKQLRS